MEHSIDKLPLLISALDDSKVSVVWNACRELAKYGDAANKALPKLNALLLHRDQTSVLWARYAIAKITGNIQTHLPFFIEALGEKKRIWAGMAATAVAGFGAEAVEAVPQLILELSDEKADNRWAAAWALAQMGMAAKAAVPALAHTLQTDGDEKVRWYVAYALSEIGASAAELPALLHALDDADDDVRGYAAQAIGRIGVPAQSALPRLQDLLDDDNPVVAAQAKTAIALLTTPQPVLAETQDASPRTP